jgi:hypothetical protein
MKLETRLETGDYTITLTQSEAMNLFEALLQAEHNDWTNGSCEDITIEITEELY